MFSSINVRKIIKFTTLQPKRFLLRCKAVLPPQPLPDTVRFSRCGAKQLPPAKTSGKTLSLTPASGSNKTTLYRSGNRLR